MRSQQSNRRLAVTLVAAGALAAGAAVAAVAARRSIDPRRATRGEAAQLSTATATVDLEPVGRVYRLHLASALESGSAPGKNFVVDGLLQMVDAPAGGSAGPATRAFQLAEPVFSSASEQISAATAATLRVAITRPFLVTYDAGQPARVLFAPDVSAATRNILMSVIAEIPGATPRISAPVVTSARDLLGQYLASVRPDGDGHGVERRKVEYRALGLEESRTVQAANVSVTIERSLWHLRFDGADHLTTLDGDEQLTVETGMPGMTPRIGTQIHLRPAGDFDARPLVAALAGARAQMVSASLVSQRVDHTASRRAADVACVRGATLEQLIAALAVPAGTDHDAARVATHAAIERLAALVRIDPAAAAAIALRMRAPGAVPDVALVQCLGLAATPSAQRALISVARDRTLARDLRRAAIHGLGQADPPQAETLAALAPPFGDDEPELGITAAYAYGTLLSVLDASDPAAAATGRAVLRARLEAATDAPARVRALASLGNAADAQSLSPIARILRGDPAPEVRAAAVSALRKVKAPGVDDLIVETMLHDVSAQVRGAALTTAGERDVTSYADRLIQVALHETEPWIRRAAVSLLGRTRATAPQTEATLATVAHNDPTPDVRKLALALVERRATHE